MPPPVDPEIPAPDPSQRGPRRRYIDSSDRAELVRRVGLSMGLVSACKSLGISERQLRNTLEASPKFRQELRSARIEPTETLVQIAHGAATRAHAPDVPLLMFLIKRADQAKQLAQARRDRLAAQAAREAALDKGEVTAAILSAVSLVLPEVPPERVDAVIARVTRLVNEVAGVARPPSAPPGARP